MNSLLGKSYKKMIPDPKIPNLYIIPDYISFQAVMFNAYEPIPRNSAQLRAIKESIPCPVLPCNPSQPHHHRTELCPDVSE
jgi:hypothetical protein